jgi:tRNA modification GTPase
VDPPHRSAARDTGTQTRLTVRARFVSDTIAARATPPGASALAVVRVSGAEARALVGSVFRGRRRIETLRGFEGAHGLIEDGKGVSDEVVVWVYRAPRSYTGEDLVEVSCHGGPLPAERVLETLWRAGARPADPGEFTRRAFLNGRIDLAQAEAVAQLIEARGERAQRSALAQLQGGLSRRVRDEADRIRAALARITVFLDFDEDVPEPPDQAALEHELRAAAGGLRRLVDTHTPSARLRGATVAIVGRPNVGKSSLLNALAGFDRALVHPAEGTTRDVVDVVVHWDGVPVRLVDTAGLRNGGDPVEMAGMERTRRELESADLVLWVVDGSAAPGEADHQVGRGLDGRHPVWVAANKTDRGQADLKWVSAYSPEGATRTSAVSGLGLCGLREELEVRLAARPAAVTDAENGAVVNERHAHALLEALTALERACGVLETGEPVELAAADLGQCLSHLGAITGDSAGPDLLDAIFSSFCIGK